MPSSKAVEATVNRFGKRRRAMQRSFLWALVQIWKQTDPYNFMSVSAAQARSVVLVDQAQRRFRVLERERMSWFARSFGAGKIPATVGDTYPRLDVNVFDVWSRPAEQFRYAESKYGRYMSDKTGSLGSRFAGATKENILDWRPKDDPGLSALFDRIQALADSETLTATRDEAHRAMSQMTDVKYWRRVVHPELSRTGSCGLCVIASTHVYKIDYLMPIHDRCECTVMPVVGKIGESGDPGLRLNQDDLRFLYGEHSNDTAFQKRLRVLDIDHGELGRVLVPARGDTGAGRFIAEEGKTVMVDMSSMPRNESSEDMWGVVKEIADDRLARGGTKREVEAFEAMRANALAHIGKGSVRGQK